MTNTPLKSSVLKSSIWSFLGTASRQLFGFGVFIVLSRMLTPEDFGLMAIAVALIEILNFCVSLGIGSYIVRQPKLTNAALSTAFWLVLGCGILATLTCALLSHPLATLFGSPHMAGLIQMLSILPTLAALTVVPEALLQRDFKFKNLALRTMLATSGAGGVSIALAFAGYGVYSLVFQRISSALIIAVMVWGFISWRPQFTFSPASARQQWVVGRSIMGSSLLNMSGLRIADMLIGYFLGAAAVGFLRIAAKLNDFIVQFTIEPIVSVALTTFSKLQEDTPALARAYQRLTQLCSLLTFPVYFGIAALAPETISLVFGPQWQPSGTLMQILCLGSVSLTLNYFFKPLMISINRPGLYFRTSLLQFVLTVLAVLLTSHLGMAAVVAGQVAVATVITAITMWLVKKHLHVKPATMAQHFLPPILSALAMAFIVILVKTPLESSLGLIPAILALGLLGAVLYAGGLYLVFPGFTHTTLKAVLPTALAILKRKKPALEQAPENQS